MFRSFLKLLFLGIMLLSPLAGSWGSSAQTHYLSFEQRWVLSYMLAGLGESSEVQQGYQKKLFQQLKSQALQAPQVIEVQDFPGFIKAYRGNWPNAESLQKDLELLEREGVRPRPQYHAHDASLQSQIDAFIQEQERFLKDKIGQRNPEGITAQDLTDTAAMDALNDEFKQISSLGKDLAETIKGDEVFNALMVKILGGYFENLSLKSKKQIISHVLGANLDATPIEKFEIMVMNSGPQFQKLLQIVAREAGVGDELLAVFRKLESKTRPVPPALVKDIIDAEKDAYGIVSYDLIPLGVGTMAQVHKGMMKAADGSLLPVVIRFIKPGIEERINEDQGILGQIAPDIDSDPVIQQSGMPKLTPLVGDLTQTVRDELKMQETIQRQNRGAQVYNQANDVRVNGTLFEMQVHVPKVYQINQPSQLMVQEYVVGSKLDKVQEELQFAYPNLKKSVVEEISKMWLQELLFDSGFFHSDMHQGNFTVQVNQTTKKVHINILDFGMGGELSTLQRRSFLLLATGTEIDDADMISEALWCLSEQDQNSISREAFNDLVKAKVSDTHRRGVQISSTGIFAWAMEKGLKFSTIVVGVNRGFSILEKMLSDSGSDLNMGSLGRVVAENNIWQLKKDLRKTGTVSYFDLLKIWVSSMKAARPVETSARMCRFVLI